MTRTAKEIFSKLDRIPAAPNFVRYNFDDLAKTLKAYVAFAKGMPTVSYVEGLKIIKDLVLGWIDADQARKAAKKLKDSPSRDAVIGFVDAFCQYAVSRNYTATPAFAEFSTTFAVGRNLFLPVKPTLVAREEGQFRPIFVFGWKTVPLDRFQRRLLMTILEDAIFSLTDFSESDAEIVFLPEVNGVRKPEVWHRGDYELLSAAELRNQLELFLSAREMAYPIIAQWLEDKFPNAAQEERPAVPDTRQISLRLEPPSNLK
ncbi:hypothetical protein [Erythrobacter sp.]|uniref:hypothetical protein n=1 Tax=Erythrobacter sp. TaxID=1042 RepID=UPI001B146A81|nr:hypothetical protein [Erythrobacter sp.]MBO6527512.1 hypothetical protein [Erythrobacter sp.]MBO6530192.1 hypothetical protein [Erythrobacter sp.]